MIIHGKCPQLYAHSLEDSACIFVLNAIKLVHKLLKVIKKATKHSVLWLFHFVF